MQYAQVNEKCHRDLNSNKSRQNMSSSLAKVRSNIIDNKIKKK